ncbi:MAG: GHKL domain-containing protein [Peptococcaceae bacterium]|nr:GHKL domain-containing protein [Peptococcaceae bacterium]
MNGIVLFSEILSTFSEALMFFLLFETFLKRRKGLSFLYFIAGIIGVTIALLICNHFLMYTLLNILGMIVVALIASTLYQGHIYTKIIAIIIGIFISGISEVLILYIETLVFKISVTNIIYISEYRLLGIILSKTLGIAICNAIRVKLKTRRLMLKPVYWFLFLLLFINAVIVAFLFFRMNFELGDLYYEKLSISSLIGLFFSTFFALYLYEHMAEQNQIIREQEQFEQQMESQLKHMDEIVLKQNELRRVKHDMVNQLIAIKSYLDNADISGGQQYVAGLTDQLQYISQSINTGNNALDAILSTKKSLAESKGIVFNTEIRIQERLPLDAKDLCIIFGNALDNAIEACDRLPENAEKRIDLLLVQDAHSLFCTLSNTAPANNDRRFTTSKADTINHGFGLQNIRDALANYGAEPSIEQEGETFSLSFNIVLQ